MSLIDYAIGRTIRLKGKSGQADQWVFYMLPAGYTDCSQISSGNTFGAVYSPSADSLVEINKSWHYTRFVIVERIESRYEKRFLRFYRQSLQRVALMRERKRYDKHKSRFYRVQHRDGQPLVRLLTTEEQVHFEGLTRNNQQAA